MTDKTKPVYKVKKKNPGGRPSKYRPAFHPKQSKKWLSEGGTKKGCAAQFGISYSQYCEWQNKYPEFGEANKDGVAVMEKTIVGSMFKSANGFVAENGQEYAPNTTAGIFLLKNINPQDWRDRREVVADVKVSDLSEDEINKRIKSLLDD